jgi:hypothetical protein
MADSDDPKWEAGGCIVPTGLLAVLGLVCALFPATALLGVVLVLMGCLAVLWQCLRALMAIRDAIRNGKSKGEN